MFVELLKSILFGIVEGICEWLPISSTGHMILLNEFLTLKVSSEFYEMFEVVIQLGAIMAVVILFFDKLNLFSKKKSESERNATYSLWLKVLVASMPAAFVGIVLDKLIEVLSGRDIDGWIYNFLVVAIALIVYGILFIVIERVQKKREPKIGAVEDIDYKSALLIGGFQMLAIVPGTSRSGSTILGARMLGISRTVAAEFSFFMGIPAMLGASLLKSLGFFSYVFKNGVSVPLLAWAVLLVATLVSFGVSLVTIKFLMNFVKTHDFIPFGIYRIALGTLLIIYYLIRD